MDTAATINAQIYPIRPALNRKVVPSVMSSQAATPKSFQGILFTVQGQESDAEALYALDILKLREILAPVPLLRLPAGNPAIAGLVNVRGDILPVLSLSHALGLSNEGSLGMLLRVEHGSRQAVLQVNTVVTIETFDADSVVPARQVLPSGFDFITGIAKSADGRTCAVLSSDALLSHYLSTDARLDTEAPALEECPLAAVADDVSFQEVVATSQEQALPA